MGASLAAYKKYIELNWTTNRGFIWVRRWRGRRIATATTLREMGARWVQEKESEREREWKRKKWKKVEGVKCFKQMWGQERARKMWNHDLIRIYLHRVLVVFDQWWGDNYVCLCICMCIFWCHDVHSYHSFVSCIAIELHLYDYERARILCYTSYIITTVVL